MGQLTVQPEEGHEGNELVTGGVYGFLRIVLTVWERFGGIVVIAWDSIHGPAERRKLYPDYKRKRIAKPGADATARQEVRAMVSEQQQMLEKLLPILGLKQFHSDGWEADDVIAALCQRFNGHRIGILSGDRDMLQLCSDKVSLIRPQPKGKFKIETPETLKAEWGLTPEQVLDLKALAGDPSDNIPGAPGIGPKTAAKLILQLGGWQSILTWAENHQPATHKWHQSLIQNRDLVKLSAELAKLHPEIELKTIPTATNAHQAFLDLSRLKFKSLLIDGRFQKLMLMGSPSRDSSPHSSHPRSATIAGGI